MTQLSVRYTAHPEPALEVILADSYLDVTVNEEIRKAIDKHWREDLRVLNIDCAAVEFMDSSGVGLLVSYHKKLEGGRKIRLKNLRPAIRGVFTLLCLEDLFEFV